MAVFDDLMQVCHDLLSSFIPVEFIVCSPCIDSVLKPSVFSLDLRHCFLSVFLFALLFILSRQRVKFQGHGTLSKGQQYPTGKNKM
ncbi:hypothetical protein COLO4_19671 [Corchorus olitorius]|uniref:Uncharacterized protein n=1 Tax=Corchorus olitorius TaxID=93759 RepID=A0A1R3J445_9ROSI|nr:hypothetical protein COLO4_19671 [Corchorus olitorius]